MKISMLKLFGINIKKRIVTLVLLNKDVFYFKITEDPDQLGFGEAT